MARRPVPEAGDGTGSGDGTRTGDGTGPTTETPGEPASSPSAPDFPTSESASPPDEPAPSPGGAEPASGEETEDAAPPSATGGEDTRDEATGDGVAGDEVAGDEPTSDEPGAASGGKADGEADGTVPLVLTLAANVAGGPALARVLVDGIEAALIEVANTTWREGFLDYEVALPASAVAGPGHTIAVQFANPAPGRGLHVDALTLGGVRHEAEDDWLSGEAPFVTAYHGRTLPSLTTGEPGRLLVAGGAGADVLEGSDGGDWIAGGAGDDVMTGGAGADVFAFSLDPGALDVVRDFEPGTDTIAMTGPPGLALSRIEEGGTGAVVTLSRWGHEQEIVLEGVAASALSDDLLL